MSRKLINHSPDLLKLQNDGFEIEINNEFLLVHNIPYVNSNKKIAYGTLVSKLELAGDITIKPSDHVIHFIGEYPCNKDGSPIKQIQYTSTDQVLTTGIIINHSFSNKPPEGYLDYYEKVNNYTNIISHQAKSIDPLVTAQTFKVIESNNSDTVFRYLDTNSSRASISHTSIKFQDFKIAIIGLGGTGSYLLDMVSKTPVKEIHIFDGDDFLQHNAFRTPGAASLKKLKKRLKKVEYLQKIYQRIHKFIIPHDYHITSSNLNIMFNMDFVFLCIDQGEIKKIIIDYLVEHNISFIDTGIGIETVDGLLRGSIRTTTFIPGKNDHLTDRIPFTNNENPEYSQNIQISEINAMNAALAIIKWKKIIGFYHDHEKELNTTYNIDVNNLINDEINL